MMSSLATRTTGCIVPCICHSTACNTREETTVSHLSVVLEPVPRLRVLWLAVEKQPPQRSLWSATETLAIRRCPSRRCYDSGAHVIADMYFFFPWLITPLF